MLRASLWSQEVLTPLSQDFRWKVTNKSNILDKPLWTQVWMIHLLTRICLFTIYRCKKDLRSKLDYLCENSNWKKKIKHINQKLSMALLLSTTKRPCKILKENRTPLVILMLIIRALLDWPQPSMARKLSRQICTTFSLRWCSKTSWTRRVSSKTVSDRRITSSLLTLLLQDLRLKSRFRLSPVKTLRLATFIS